MDPQTRTTKQRPAIDGETYKAWEHKLTAGDVFGYAGKSCASHYLVEVCGQREQR